MIQRVQTLYLLLVVILGSLLCFFSPVNFYSPQNADVLEVYRFGFANIYNVTNPQQPVAIMNTVSLTIISLAIPLIAFVVIFLYKKRILQARINVINVVLCIGWYAILALYVWFAKTKFYLDWYPTAFVGIPLINLILTLMATRRILRDEALVRAADRIR